MPSAGRERVKFCKYSGGDFYMSEGARHGNKLSACPSRPPRECVAGGGFWRKILRETGKFGNFSIFFTKGLEIYVFMV